MRETGGFALAPQTMPRVVPRQHRRGCRTGGQREARASSPNLVKAGTPRSERVIITPAPRRTLILVKVPCSIVLVLGEIFRTADAANECGCDFSFAAENFRCSGDRAASRPPSAAGGCSAGNFMASGYAQAASV